MSLRLPQASLALALAAVAVAGCGGAPGTSPGFAFAPMVFGGHGDQVSPALGDDVLAYVDYALDATGGCDNTQADADCAGRLVVVSLRDRKPIARLPVGIAHAAIGQGFVAFTEPATPRSTYGAVKVWRFDGTTVEQIDSSSMADATVRPAVDGTRIGWVEPNGQGPMVDDLSTGKISSLEAETPWVAGALALSGGRAAFGDLTRADNRFVVTLVGLATGDRRTFPLEDQTGMERVVALTLTPDILAWKEAQPYAWCAAGTCPTRIVIVRLADDSRTVLTVPTMSRYGPVLLLGDQVAWLDDRDGPYALYAAPLSGGEATRLTPKGARLPYVDPAATASGRLAWAQRPGDDLDIAVAPLR